jgi:hypothetical protein
MKNLILTSPIPEKLIALDKVEICLMISSLVL